MHPILAQLIFALKTKPAKQRHRPSGVTENLSGNAGTIEDYIQSAKGRINSARKGINGAVSDFIIDGNAPFYLAAEGGESRRIVIMLHGLTDSPFITRDLAKYFSQQGFRVFSILLPGHGTCPGDLLDVSWHDWLRAQARSIDMATDNNDEIYLCGFSLGAALNIFHALLDKRIRGLFLFSPAIRLRSIARIACGLKTISRWIPHLNWVDVQPDDDPFKYESITANAICQSRHMVTQLRHMLSLAPIDVPVFIAASEDDETVKASGAVALFGSLKSTHKRMLYYSRSRPDVPEGVRVINSVLPEKHIVSSSHTAMIVAPENPHYGEHGSYAFCAHYHRTNQRDYFHRCKAHQEDCLGEFGRETGPGQVLRRLTYNPWYAELTDELDLFIKNII